MAWNLNDLMKLVEAQSNLTASQENDAILITNEDGIDAFITVCGEQILVESLLCSVDQVKDSAAFNKAAMRAHINMFPLTSIGITSVNTEEYYVAFGSLSAESMSESIQIEIETLFLNIEGMVEFFEEFID